MIAPFAVMLAQDVQRPVTCLTQNQAITVDWVATKVLPMTARNGMWSMTEPAPLDMAACIECLLRISERPEYEAQTLRMFDNTGTAVSFKANPDRIEIGL